jgi:hypothetical protein
MAEGGDICEVPPRSRLRAAMHDIRNTRPLGCASEEKHMRRKTLDTLLSTIGMVVAAILIVAGLLLTWAHSFVGNQVHDQLAAQQIFFPPAGSDALNTDPEITRYVTPYAGQQIVTGRQAEVYADHYIRVHLSQIAEGKTYSQVSEDYRAAVAKDPDAAATTQLAGQRQALFMGESLRGLLLNAYAFGTMAKIAGIAAVVSFIGAALMLLLAALGFWHSRRTSAEVELLTGLPTRSPALAVP